MVNKVPTDSERAVLHPQTDLIANRMVGEVDRAGSLTLPISKFKVSLSQADNQNVGRRMVNDLFAPEV